MIYLDSAATTLQKPPAVARAVQSAMQTMASPGRGGHKPAMLAANKTFACRELAAQFFDVSDPERVVFTFNATHALNIAITSVVKPGMRVLTSALEHNAVTRPLAAMEGVAVRAVQAPLFDRRAFLRAFEAELAAGADAVVTTHVSNVFGFILPIEQMAALCRRQGVPLVIDASQSAGCLPVRLEALGAAYIGLPGHKSLYGPQGTGVLLVGRGQVPHPLLRGGTGSASARSDMPDFLPDRLEAGTHNVPGIAGLLEGLRYVARSPGVLDYERELTARMIRALRRLGGVEVFADPSLETQVGVLSFRIAGVDCEEAARRLGERGICVRAGLHCAPAAHRTAGTDGTGTVRASVSAFNTPCEIDRFTDEIERIVRGK